MSNVDVQKAFEAITSKREVYTRAFSYYDGVQPLVYANDRLNSVFKGPQVRFTENWCAVVVDAVKERIELSSFTVPDNLRKEMDNLQSTLQLSLLSDSVHENAVIAGESFVIVWKNPDTDEVEIYPNDPRLCHAFYRVDKPREMRYAAKLWVDDETGQYRMILYYPDRLEYYFTERKATSVTNGSSFIPDTSESHPDGSAANPYSRIPVFHFRLSDRTVKGDLTDVIPLQNGINKLLTDMMVAAEFGAFKQRWIVSNADISALKNSPNEIWHLPAGDSSGQPTQVGEFSPTDLSNYLDAVGRLAADISRITRVPLHYFYSTGGFPSGEALAAMESPLNFKVKDRLERFEVVWKDVVAFALHLRSNSEVSPSQIGVQWENVQTVQPETEAKILVLRNQAGIPLVTSLRKMGWTETELTNLTKDRESSGKGLAENLIDAFNQNK